MESITIELDSNNSNIIQTLSILIAFLTVIVAIIAIWVQHQQFKKKIEPLLAPALRTFEVDGDKVTLDWDTRKPLGGEYSGTSMHLYNFGGSTVFNVGYNYKLLNRNQIEMEIKKKNTSENHMGFGDDRAFFTGKVNQGYFVKLTSDLPMRRVDKIKEGEKTDILLPAFYLLIFNHLYGSRKKINRNFVQPKVLLEITYQDLEFNKWIIKHELIVDSSLNYAIKDNNDDYLEILLSTKFIEKRKIK